MSNNWLITPEELENYSSGETLEEAVVRLDNTVSCLVNQEEAKRKRQKAYIEKRSKLNRKHFVKFYKMKNRELTKSKMLSKAEKAFLYDVLPYVSMETSLITDEFGIPMDAKDLIKLCDISKSTFYEISKHLTEIQVLEPIEKDNRTYYKLSPEYFECG